MVVDKIVNIDVNVREGEKIPKCKKITIQEWIKT